MGAIDHTPGIIAIGAIVVFSLILYGIKLKYWFSRISIHGHRVKGVENIPDLSKFKESIKCLDDFILASWPKGSKKFVYNIRVSPEDTLLRGDLCPTGKTLDGKLARGTTYRERLFPFTKPRYVIWVTSARPEAFTAHEVIRHALCHHLYGYYDEVHENKELIYKEKLVKASIAIIVRRVS